VGFLPIYFAASSRHVGRNRYDPPSHPVDGKIGTLLFEDVGMTRSQQPAERGAPRSRATLAAFIVGIPAAAGILAAVHREPLCHLEAARYVKHPVEGAVVVMFCMALAALGTKFLGSLRQRAALGAGLLPAWDGKPVPASQAEQLLAALEQKPAKWQDTWFGRRIAAVLDFVHSRGSAADLDDQMRGLADQDAMALESSYSLTRFITWAVPILGFLGTVLGITGAISGVTPEKLEHDLNAVTDGLALAFDTTALALGLTMVMMFLSFLTERAEQSVLERVDAQVERHLAHRFERVTGEGGAVVESLRQTSQTLLQTVEKLVERQAAVWAKSFEETDKRRVEAEQRVQGRIAEGLEAAMQKTLETHAQRLLEVERQSGTQTNLLIEKLSGLASAVRESGREQQTLLSRVAQAMTTQAESLSRLQEGERHLLRLQESLKHNLDTLAGAGAFEQAVHSLTAAIHLLTMHPRLGEGSNRRPGAAA